MKKIINYMSLVCLTILFCVACTSIPLSQKYETKFSKLKLGETTKSEVKGMFPKAYTGGQQVSKSGIRIDVLIFKESQYDISVDNFVHQAIYFYFAEDKLVQWGRPQDWKDRDPEVVIHDQRSTEVSVKSEDSDMYSELMKLKQLKEEGILSEEEFQKEKKEILEKY